MIEIPTHEAKTHLSKYLNRANHGETIVIMRGRRPMAKLVPIGDNPQPDVPLVGQMLDKRLELPDEVFHPLSKSELSDWGL